MDHDLLVELNKKDDDLDVITENNEVILITSLSDGELGLEEEESFLDSDMLIDEAMGPRIDIVVQVTRAVFMVNTVCSLLLLTGFIPYSYLTFDESSNIRFIILGIWLAISVVFYILMAIWRRSKMALAFFMMWILSYYILVVDIAAILHDFTPLQFGLITFAQYLFIVVYTVWSPAVADAWKSLYIMLGMGLLAWGMGIYAFILQKDWIQAVILFIAMVVNAGYSAIQIRYMTRYNVSNEDILEATIRFYADPAIWVYNKIF